MPRRTPTSRRSVRRGRRRTRAHHADAPIAEAKLFMNGRSQAVRLPAEYRFEGESVYVKRWRNAVILLPKEDPWRPLLESLGHFSEDFLRERDQPEQYDVRRGL